MLHAIWESVRSIGVLDIFDIAVVTTVIYLATLWVRRTKAIRVLEGALALTALYVVANHMGLMLTTSMFRGFSTIVMVSLISLFQEDLRHFLERVTVFRHPQPRRQSLEAIVCSVEHFAKNRIGALIVMSGRDPLERHIAGGQSLGGQISSALLESLFDPHSDGHDGAVVILGDQVERFGAHLPLSHSLDHGSGFGTRHAAALGLAETCDALCVVVSEQRGTVHVARGGELWRVANRRLLMHQLRIFLKEKAPVSRADTPWLFLWDHRWEKAFSLACGIALWLVFVKGVKPMEKTMELPIVVSQVPDGYRVEHLTPVKGQVTVQGLERDLRRLGRDGLAIKVEVLSKARGTVQVPLSPQSVQIPPSVRLVTVSPAAVSLQLKRSPAGSPRLASAAAGKRHRAWFRW